MSADPASSRLKDRYPDRPEDAVLKVGLEVGSFGASDRMGRLLNFEVCPSGLRVAPIWPLGKRLFVPWTDIEVERRPGVYASRAVLRFGHPEIGRLNILGHVANRLARAIPAKWPEAAPIEDETRGQAFFRVARAWVLFSTLWLVMVAVGLRFAPPNQNSPPLIFLAAPIILSGAVSILSYHRRIRR